MQSQRKLDDRDKQCELSEYAVILSTIPSPSSLILKEQDSVKENLPSAIERGMTGRMWLSVGRRFENELLGFRSFQHSSYSCVLYEALLRHLSHISAGIGAECCKKQKNVQHKVSSSMPFYINITVAMSRC